MFNTERKIMQGRVQYVHVQNMGAHFTAIVSVVAGLGPQSRRERQTGFQETKLKIMSSQCPLKHWEQAG